MGQNIYPDLTNSEYDVKYARRKILQSDLHQARTMPFIEQTIRITGGDSGGGSTMRFGYPGEDVTAAEDRYFSMSGYQFSLDGTYVNFILSDTVPVISIQNSYSTLNYSISMPTSGLPVFQLFAGDSSTTTNTLVQMWPSGNYNAQATDATGTHAVSIYPFATYLISSGYSNTILYVQNLPAMTTETNILFYDSATGQVKYGAAPSGGSYTDEQAQDAIGIMVIDTNTIDVTYTDTTPELKWDVRTQMSITSDTSGIKLSGDSTTPGNSKYYGTDSSGTKGYYSLSSDTNIYNTDGTLTANRTITLGGKQLFINRGTGFNSIIDSVQTDFIHKHDSTHYSEIYAVSNGTSAGVNYVLLNARAGSAETTLTVNPGGILIADGTQGANKVLTSDASGNASWKLSNRVIYYSATSNTNNSGSNPQDLITLTIPAGTLANSGDKIEIHGGSNFLTSSGSKTIQIKLSDGTNNSQLSRSTTASEDQEFLFTIVYQDSTHAIVHSFIRHITTIGDVLQISRITWDFTQPLTIVLQCTAGAANDMIARYLSAACYLN